MEVDIMKNKNKLRMLWPYNYHDRSTWKYIDLVLYGEKKDNNSKVSSWILNPDFKYAHLDKSL